MLHLHQLLAYTTYLGWVIIENQLTVIAKNIIMIVMVYHHK